MSDAYWCSGGCGRFLPAEKLDLGGRCSECGRKWREERDARMKTIAWRETREAAQADLDAYAEAKRLLAYEVANP